MNFHYAKVNSFGLKWDQAKKLGGEQKLVYFGVKMLYIEPRHCPITSS